MGLINCNQCLFRTLSLNDMAQAFIYLLSMPNFMNFHIFHGFPYISWISMYFMDFHIFHGFPYISWISIYFMVFHIFSWNSLNFIKFCNCLQNISEKITTPQKGRLKRFSKSFWKNYNTKIRTLVIFSKSFWKVKTSV